MGNQSVSTTPTKNLINMESSARFPEIDATDLLKMRENNQSKNNERSTKGWVKVFDLWRAEGSEVRKLESNICHVHQFLDAI